MTSDACSIDGMVVVWWIRPGKMDEVSTVRNVLQPGTTLGGTYRVGRIIGEGGMGEVYEARHARLSGRYAIKVIRREVVSLDPATVQRFRREAEITSSLRHPNIVQVIDFDVTTDGAPFIVMEYLEGSNLRTRMAQRGPMPISEVLVIVEQIASALAAAHGQGVVHRDLKPANVFLVPLPATVAGHPTEFVKVLDFGISKAKAAGTLTQQPNIMGTPHYMAPEQARMQNDAVDGRTDQFALGALTYEMMTGRKAFPGDTLESVLFGVVHEQPAPLAPVTGEAVEQVVMTALAKDKAQRHPSVTAFATALHEAAQVGPSRVDSERRPRKITFDSAGPVVGQVTPAPPTLAGPAAALLGTPGPAPAVARRLRGPLAVLAGAALAAAAALLLISKRDHRDAQVVSGADLHQLASSIRGRVERAVADEGRALEAKVQAAARIAELRNAAATHVDAFTFNDLFATEEWWQPYRHFATLVFDGERPLVTRGLPDVTTSAPWRFWAAHGQQVTSAIITGEQRAYLAAGVALDGKDARGLVLAGMLDGERLVSLARRAQVDRLIVSDGKRLFGLPPGAGPPEAAGQLAALAGRESESAVALAGDFVAMVTPRPGAVWIWAVVKTGAPADAGSH